MPQQRTKEIEVQGVGRFQVPYEYTDARVSAHINGLRKSRPEIFRAQTEDAAAKIDAALGGNHPCARRGKALAREHPHRGMHELAASVLRRQRLLFTALGFRLYSDGASARPAGAWRAARGRSGW